MVKAKRGSIPLSCGLIMTGIVFTLLAPLIALVFTCPSSTTPNPYEVFFTVLLVGGFTFLGGWVAGCRLSILLKVEEEG